MTIPPTGLPGVFNVVALPIGWRLKFRNGDHHIGHVRLRTTLIEDNQHRPPGGILKWEASIAFLDKNYDDPFESTIEWLILGLPNSYVHYGRRVLTGADFEGGKLQRQEVFQLDYLKNYNDVIVVLLGWDFEFYEDHHIARIGIRLKDQKFEKDEGRLSWTAESVFADKNGDETPFVRYDILIIALAGEVGKEFPEIWQYSSEILYGVKNKRYLRERSLSEIYKFNQGTLHSEAIY